MRVHAGDHRHGRIRGQHQSAQTRRAVQIRNRKPEPVPLPPNPTPVDLSPSPDDLWSHAKAAADIEKWDEAREWLDRSEQNDPFQPQTHYLRALIELQCGNFELGLLLLRRSVYCDAGFALAHYVLGDLCQQQGARKEAARHWQFALNAVANHDAQQILPYSDDLTAEMLVELLVARLSDL